jgi:hypothetical protein
MAAELDAAYADLDAAYALLDALLLVERCHGFGHGRRAAALRQVTAAACRVLYPPQPADADDGDGTGSYT